MLFSKVPKMFWDWAFNCVSCKHCKEIFAGISKSRMSVTSTKVDWTEEHCASSNTIWIPFIPTDFKGA